MLGYHEKAFSYMIGSQKRSCKICAVTSEINLAYISMLSTTEPDYVRTYTSWLM
jgi:hypothetical protein